MHWFLIFALVPHKIWPRTTNATEVDSLNLEGYYTRPTIESPPKEDFKPCAGKKRKERGGA